MNVRCRVSASLLATAIMLLGGNAAFARGLDLSFTYKYLGPASFEPDAIKRPEEGGLRDGHYVTVLSDDVTVYRLFDNEDAGMLGRFWVFEPPTGDNAQYRRDYGVCADWNALTHPVTCRLLKGTTIIVGPGQSVSCKKPPRFIPASEALQVFIPNPKKSCKIGWALN